MSRDVIIKLTLKEDKFDYDQNLGLTFLPKKIYYALYSTSFTEGVNTFNVYNHSNLGGDQTTLRLITLLDSKPLQVGL